MSGAVAAGAAAGPGMSIHAGGSGAAPQGRAASIMDAFVSRRLFPQLLSKDKSLRNKIRNEAFSGQAIVYGASVAALGEQRR